MALRLLLIAETIRILNVFVFLIIISFPSISMLIKKVSSMHHILSSEGMFSL